MCLLVRFDKQMSNISSQATTTFISYLAETIITMHLIEDEEEEEKRPSCDRSSVFAYDAMMKLN